MAKRRIFAGARLKALRAERGLGQAAMGELLEISPSYLSQLEHHPSMRNRFVPTFQLIEVMMTSHGDWQGRFAKRVLRHWNGADAMPGAGVWVRQGALRERPDEILQWVEGDSSRYIGPM